MSPLIGWGLAVLAVAVGYASYGGPGVVLAVTVVVFWLLLQFSRAVRVMRLAAGRPVGAIDNAVVLHSKLDKGMRLLQVIMLTRSLGRKLSDDPETFAWTDAAGDQVTVELRNGRVQSWQLRRQVAS